MMQVYPAVFQSLSNFTSMSMTDWPGRTYRYYHGPSALWPFGFGLSYTEFILGTGSGFINASEPIPFTGILMVNFTVHNAGAYDGRETVFAFFAPLQPLPPKHVPLQQLFDYVKVEVAAGDTVSLSFNLTPDVLALTTDSGTRQLFSGAYSIILSRGHGATLILNVKVQ